MPVEVPQSHSAVSIRLGKLKEDSSRCARVVELVHCNVGLPIHRHRSNNIYHLFDRTFVNPSTKSIGCIIGFCLATDAHERNQPYWSPVRLGVVGSFNLASHNVLEASPNNDC